MKAILTIGCGGSGKSTFARELIRNNINPDTGDSSWVKVERDSIRETICKHHNQDYSILYNNLWSHWQSKWEKEVNPIRDKMLAECATKGQNVIISDTNLGIANRDNLITHIQSFGYEVETMVFGETMTLDDLWKNNLNRKNVLPHNVVAEQYARFRQEFPLYSIKDTTDKQKAIIYDIDGTASTMLGRSPYEWEKVGQDIPNNVLFSGIIGQYMAGNLIIFMSGRDEVCRPETTKWLDDAIREQFKEIFGQDKKIPYLLFMRPQGDMRKDTIIKHELFNQHVDGNYEIVGVYDDRACVTRLWYDLGFRVYHCANPWVEF